MGRVHYAAMSSDLKMQVVAGGSAGAPYQADYIALVYLLANPYVNSAHVSVPGGVAVTVINNHMVAETYARVC